MTVLSHDYWATRLGANPAVLNDTIVVNGQALTIVGVAPRGFSGTTLGSEPKCVRADHDARVDVARVEGIRQPPELLGVPVRAAEAGHVDRAGARGDERRVPADHQRRRSAAAEGHERPDDGAVQGAKPIGVEPGYARPELDPPRGARRRCCSSWPSPASCCSSRARTSPTCCSRAAQAARPRWPSGSRSARAAAQLLMQLLTESCVLAVLGGIAGLRRRAVDARAHRLAAAAGGHGIAAVRAAGRTSSCSPRSCRSRPGCSSACSPRCTARSRISCPPSRRRPGSRPGARAAARFRTSLVTAQIALSMALLMAAGLFVKSLVERQPRRSRARRSTTS